MATDVIPNRVMHDEFKKSPFFKTPIQEEEDEECDPGIRAALIENSLNGADSLGMDPENDVSDSESESEETNDEIREKYDVSQSLKDVARTLKLVSQESNNDNEDTDDIVLKNVKEYRRNFDGFAAIVPFESLFAMHEYIRANLQNRPNEKHENSKQDVYLNILLRVRPEDRFAKLLECCDSIIIRRILLANRIILQELLKTASIEKLPCPIAFDNEDSQNFQSRDDEDDAAESNIKPWYMLELIGVWLNFINDQQTFRDQLRNELLEKCLAGISVPLKFK